MTCCLMRSSSPCLCLSHVAIVNCDASPPAPNTSSCSTSTATDLPSNATTPFHDVSLGGASLRTSTASADVPTSMVSTPAWYKSDTLHPLHFSLFLLYINILTVTPIQRVDTLTTLEALGNYHISPTYRNTSTHVALTTQIIYYRQRYQTYLQCFDAVGWAAGRASGL